MIEKLKAELDRINQKLKIVEEDYHNCLMIKKSVTRSLYKGSDDEKYKIRCFYDIQRLEQELQTIKKVSLMWADEMLGKFLENDNGIIKVKEGFAEYYVELEEIKSLMEKQ